MHPMHSQTEIGLVNLPLKGKNGVGPHSTSPVIIRVKCTLKMEKPDRERDISGSNFYPDKKKKKNQKTPKNCSTSYNNLHEKGLSWRAG